MRENPQTVNSAQGASTSDGISRPNGMTREQWLHAVLYSGRVSRIGQHLALVLYHLADTTTNIAKLSARDLERITGWSRTAIIEHLNELHKLGEFLLVTWGQGRAKSTFELQGIIAEAMAAKKVERDAAAIAAATPSVSVPDTQADTTVATNSYGNVAATEVAATAATTASVSLADTNNPRCVSVADTTSEKAAEGGTIGGECNSRVETHTLTLSPREREKPPAPDWMVSEDGGFEGQVFELTGVEVGALQTTYGYLDFPADLVAVDQFLGRQFAQLECRPAVKDQLARMHTYLAKRNREARELRLRMGGIDKPQPRPVPRAEADDAPSCWFDNDARLQVANGFRVELLETVGGDEIQLREALDEAAGWVGVQVRGPQLVAKVRSQITKQSKGLTNTRGGSGLARSGISDRNELTKALRRIEAETNGSKRGGFYGD